MDVTIHPKEFRPAWAFVAGNAERGRKEMVVEDNYHRGKMHAYKVADRGAARNFILFDLPAPDDGGAVLRLAATREGLWAGAIAAGVAAHSPGRCLVLPDDLNRILKVCGDEPVRLVSRPDGTISCRWGRASAEFRSADPDTFPAPPAAADSPGRYLASAADVARAVKLVGPCCDPDSTRYALGGILIAPAPEGGLECVATDGTQAARCVVPAAVDGAPVAPSAYAPVVPIRACRELADLAALGGPDGRLALEFLPGGPFRGSSDVGSIATPLVQGRFPSYRDDGIFPDPSDAPIRFATARELARLAELASATAAPPDNLALLLATRDGQLSLAMRTPLGEGRAVHGIDGTTRRAPVAVDYRRLVRAARSLDPDAPCELELRGPAEPITLRQGGFCYTTMTLAVHAIPGPTARRREPVAASA